MYVLCAYVEYNERKAPIQELILYSKMNTIVKLEALRSSFVWGSKIFNNKIIGFQTGFKIKHMRTPFFVYRFVR